MLRSDVADVDLSVGSKRKCALKFKTIDLFSKDLPGFTLKGEHKVRTNPGAVLTIILLTIVFLYGLLKFIQLEARDNPNISTY